LKIKSFLILIVLSFTNLYSQPAEEWVRRYNGPDNSFDIVSDLILGNNNNVFVYGSSSGTGSLYDFTIINYDRDGNTKWIQYYNGPGNSTDQINSACLDLQNNSYVTGFTTDLSFNSYLTTAKYDSSGNLIWMKEFRNSLFLNGYGVDIALDQSENVLVCGTVRHITTGKYSSVILKYSKDGNLSGKLIYDSTGITETVPVKIKIGPTGNIVVAGSSNIPPGRKDMNVTLINDFPNIAGTFYINGSSNEDDEITDMILDNESNIYICGNMRNTLSSSDYYYAKLDPSGNIIWQGIFNGTGNNIDIPYAITLDKTDNVYLTGYSKNSSIIGSEDVLTLKVSPSGNLIWNRVYDGSGNGTDQGITIAAGSDGSLYVGGGTDRESNDMIYLLLRYDADGNLQWVKNYYVSDLSEDFIYDIKLDQENNIYVTGISSGINSAYDFATIKYSQTAEIIQMSNNIPDGFFLNQNYPNPFNPTTNLEFRISKIGFVSLKVYDLLGNEVKILVNEVKPPGSYILEFDGSSLASGIYFYSLTAGNYTERKKMILLK
jgi:hypothetical protein